jgi:hypothetical protein
MSEATGKAKTQRYSKNCFKIKGRPDLFIKQDVLVSFTPLPKKLFLPNLEKASDTLQFSLDSTMTADITL